MKSVNGPLIKKVTNVDLTEEERIEIASGLMNELLTMGSTEANLKEN